MRVGEGSIGAICAAIAVVVTATLAPVAPAEAAVRSKLDRWNEVRFTLDGRTLTARIVDLPRYRQHPSTKQELFGRPVRAACGTSFRDDASYRTIAVARATWPRGAMSFAFDLNRDVSRRVKWCLIEGDGKDGGGDLAFVSFRRAEPRRLLAKGRGPGGEWWRLSAWRSERLAPCLALQGPGGRVGQCFDDEAEREARFAVGIVVSRCRRGDTYVFGAVARSTRSVTVTLSDGTSVPGTVYRRPRGSRVRARYFLAVLPGAPTVVAVEARDREGRRVGRNADPDGLGSFCSY